MINLLNPTDIRELRAARVNVRLRRFAVLTFITVGIIGAAYAVNFQIVSNEYNEAMAKSSATDEQLTEFVPVKSAADEYRANLAIAKKILGSEITFSTFITDVATALPPNTILDSLALSTKSIGIANGKPIETELIARAKGYSDVLALKTNLEQKTNLFSAVRITSTALISDSDNAIIKAYPYTVTFGVVIAQQGGQK